MAAMVSRVVARGRSVRQHIAPHRLALLVAVVAVIGGVALVAATVTAVVHPRPIGLMFAVVIAATFVTDATSIDLRFGNHIESYTWAEVGVVLGLALVPAEQLVLSSLALAIAYVATRRAPVKVLYNTTSYAVGIVIAAAVTHLVVDPSWSMPARSALALTLGALAFSWWNGIAVDAAIAFSQQLSFRHTYRKGMRLRTIVCLGNVALALGVLALAHADSDLLLLVPPCLGIAFLGYRGYLRAIQERTIWRHLEATAADVTRLDEDEIAEVAAARVRALVEADEVELCIAPSNPQGTERRYVCDRNGETTRLPARRAGDSVSASLENAATGQVEGTLIPIPLVAHNARIGELRVRFATEVKLNERERHALGSYAIMIATSIENARLYAEMREHAARNEVAARHDWLTGLPNRVLLHERVQELLGDATSQRFAVMLIDLDRFKDVNDGLGHAAGDAVLQTLAARIRDAVRACDVVARLGGDEFAVLITGDAPVEPAARRILAALAEPIEIAGIHVALGASIGIVCSPQDGATFDELLQRADIAMYEAKQCRSTFRRYRHCTRGSTIDKLSLAAELRSALDDHQLALFFQPQIDLTSNEPVGAEALVRWHHPTRGLLLPSEFVGLFESSNLLRDFTRRVLDLALAECARWRSAGRPLRVAVNLSARDLDDERLPDDVKNALVRHEVSPDRLVLEITETAILGDLDLVEHQLARLASLGVSLSIDDFGTGHSNLTFLQRVRVHELKIDRSFVAGIVSNENDAIITRATVGLGRSLGLRTVAEGVEETRVLEQLLGVGCDHAQGYLWSRPVPAPQIRVLLGVAEPDREVSVDEPVPRLEDFHNDTSVITRRQMNSRRMRSEIPTPESP
jgi:diguanylate cyclase (GGDEF)-like protein